MDEKFIINPKAPQHMVAQSQEFYDAIDGQLEVTANQAWNRFSTNRGNSAYFVRRTDDLLAVTIEGGSWKRHRETAIFHWGVPKREYEGPNGEQAAFWRMSLEDLVPTAKAVLTDNRTLVDDSVFVKQVDAILDNPAMPGGDKLALAKRRIGHSKFSKEVKSSAGNRCMVKQAITRHLISSHIKPWVLCKPEEKTDTGNGLCLSPDMDKLFEDGIISFDDDGGILVKYLKSEELHAYGITGSERIAITGAHRHYLSWHRHNVFEQQ